MLPRKRLYSCKQQLVHLYLARIANIDKAGPKLNSVIKLNPDALAIATALDTELAELQARLAKARQIKQGMMRELQTGRIRLL